MPTTAPVVEPCDHCDTWAWCLRRGCVAWCEESARALAEVTIQEKERALREREEEQ